MVSGKSRLRAIVHWNNPVRSGTWFAAGLALFYLTTVRGLSVLSVASLLAGVALIVRLAVASASRALSGAPPPGASPPPPREPYFRPDVVTAWATAFADTGNEVADDLHPVLSGGDACASAKALVALTGTYLLGRVVADGVLGASAWVAAFTLPSVYRWKREEIDAAVGGLAAGVRGGVARGVDGVGGGVSVARARLAEGGGRLLEGQPALRGWAASVGLAPGGGKGAEVKSL